MSYFSEGYYRRFSGIARLYGETALAKFRDAHVCVIGLGGIGSWATEALVRSGIGHITLMDMDDICLTNTNRQLHAMEHTIGDLKTTAMAQRLKMINPECQVAVIDDFVCVDNLAHYFDPQKNVFDFILDAIDTVKDKAAFLAYCKRQKLNVIMVGGAGGKKDPTKITIADLAKTVHDPLASKVRERLKYDYGVNKNSKGKLGIPCVFSSEQVMYPQPDGQVCRSKKTAMGTQKMDCSAGLGAITTVTATFGFAAVARILAKLA